MSNDTDDQTLLASVYLDNEASPDERALVETSTETLAVVESLGQVRTVLAATTPQASLAEREAHLAGALDVFDRMSDLERSGEVTPASGVDAAAAAALSTPRSSSDTGRHRRPERRTTSTWMLSAAAGLLVLAGVGAVAFGVITGGDDNDSSDAAPAAVNDKAQSEAELVEELIPGELSGDGSADLSAGSAEFDSDDVFASDDELTASAPAETDSAQGDAMDESDVAEDGLFPPDAATEPVATSSEPAPPPQEFDLDVLDDLDDLADFATLAISSLNPDGEVDPPDVDYELVEGSCEERHGVQERAGYALYDGEIVQVGVDLVNRIVYAYTEPDCTLIAQTELADDPRVPVGPTPTQP